jgi:hypothetical protein
VVVIPSGCNFYPVKPSCSPVYLGHVSDSEAYLTGVICGSPTPVPSLSPNPNEKNPQYNRQTTSQDKTIQGFSAAFGFLFVHFLGKIFFIFSTVRGFLR